jgi:methylated-DNA-[protein]-cysteine S-methyltransferase
MKLTLSKLNSPMGELVVATDAQDQLRTLDFTEPRLRRSLREHYGQFELEEGTTPEGVSAPLRAYFDGELDALRQVPVATKGSPLQEKVWALLRTIPAGQTMSYGQIARDLGLTDPRAAIDIGAANAANPVAIVVPCHRVIAKNGDLKGYAWGLQRKRWLLEKEGAIAAPAPAATSTASGSTPHQGELAGC